MSKITIVVGWVIVVTLTPLRVEFPEIVYYIDAAIAAIMILIGGLVTLGMLNEKKS